MIKKIFIISILISIFLTGCNNEENIYEPYEIQKEEPIPTETKKDLKEETETISEEKIQKLEKILEKSEQTIEVSKTYNGLDMSHLLLKKYSENKLVTLGEIVNNNKPTVIFITSPFCPSCKEIRYTNILNLSTDANIIVATLETLEDDDFFEEKGIISNVCLIDGTNIIDNFIEDKSYIDKYRTLTTIATPSCIFINKDNEFEFIVNAIKHTDEIESYLKYIN